MQGSTAAHPCEANEERAKPEACRISFARQWSRSSGASPWPLRRRHLTPSSGRPRPLRANRWFSGEAKRSPSRSAIRSWNTMYSRPESVAASESRSPTTPRFRLGQGVRWRTYFFDPKNLKGNLMAQIKKGTMLVRSGDLTKQQPGSVQIKTPRTVLGVRGTTFVIAVDE